MTLKRESECGNDQHPSHVCSVNCIAEDINLSRLQLWWQMELHLGLDHAESITLQVLSFLDFSGGNGHKWISSGV
jgi:hypothetical protein